jgi:hypothetical protein
MQEIGRAHALERGTALAMQTIARLLREPPREAPPEVAVELAASWRRRRRWVGKIGGIAYGTVILYLPFLLWAGVRDTASVVAFFVGCYACSLLSLTAARMREPGPSIVLAAMLVSTATFASASTFLGPYLMVPTLVAVNTAAFVVHLEGWHRIAAVVAGCLAVLVPIALSVAGVLPGGVEITADGLLMRPGAIDLSGPGALVLLAVTAVGSVLTVSFTLGRLRDDLSSAERQLFTYVWHLREIVPPDVRGPTDPTGKRRGA